MPATDHTSNEQFQPTLFDAPTGPAKMTEWADVTKGMRPVHDEVDQPRAITPVHVKGYGEVRPYVGGYHDTHERQLQMLMSAREIQQQYAPAEGDRMYKGTDHYVNAGNPPPGVMDTRAGEITDRRMTTDGRLNERWNHPVTGERYFKRTAEGARPPIETNTEMWQRKSREAAESPQEARDRHIRHYKSTGLAPPEAIAKFAATPLTHDVSLIEHLQAGGDTGIIPLGVTSNPLSSSRKPMVAGGQHRIAALGEIDPDRLVPVEHYKNTHDAKYMPKPGGKKGELVKRPGYS